MRRREALKEREELQHQQFDEIFDEEEDEEEEN